MKGHLEIFENRLKNIVAKLPNVERLDLNVEFLAFEQALGDKVPYYDVTSGPTLADYYASAFTQFIKEQIRKQS